MASYDYVIIGGGIAGGRAVEGIRDRDKEGTVIQLTQEPHRSYERPPLSKGYLRGEEGLDKVYLRAEDYYSDNDIEVMAPVRASGVNPAERTVALETGQSLEYGKLLLATGARAWRLPAPGSDLPGVFTLRTIEDSGHIREAARDGKRALVLGGSFIGCEVAASLAQLGANVTMAFLEERLLDRIMPQEVSAFLRKKYEAEGVRIIPGARLGAIQGDGQVEHAVLDNGETLDVEMVVMGVGVRLNTELARDAGLELDERGAVVVDEYLRTSDPNIYAAGDIAAWPDPTFGKRLRVEHWDVARQQGRRAGRNMAGDERPYTALPYFFSDLFDFSYETWGDLTAWDQTMLRGSVEDGSFWIWYFGQGRLVAGLEVSRPRAEHKVAQALIQARPSYQDVAAQLTDERVDLATLVG